MPCMFCTRPIFSIDNFEVTKVVTETVNRSRAAQWPSEKRQKDKQWSINATQKTKDRATLKTSVPEG